MKQIIIGNGVGNTVQDIHLNKEKNISINGNSIKKSKSGQVKDSNVFMAFIKSLIKKVFPDLFTNMTGSK